MVLFLIRFFVMLLASMRRVRAKFSAVSVPNMCYESSHATLFCPERKSICVTKPIQSKQIAMLVDTKLIVSVKSLYT